MKTKNSKVVKNFDAIKTMRAIRDKICLDIMDMTYEEEREYIDTILRNEKMKTDGQKV